MKINRIATGIIGLNLHGGSVPNHSGGPYTSEATGSLLWISAGELVDELQLPEIEKGEHYIEKLKARAKLSFFYWVRISPEIDWCHYQGASPAPTCIVRHQTMTKTPTR